MCHHTFLIPAKGFDHPGQHRGFGTAQCLEFDLQQLGSDTLERGRRDLHSQDQKAPGAGHPCRHQGHRSQRRDEGLRCGVAANACLPQSAFW